MKKIIRDFSISTCEWCDYLTFYYPNDSCMRAPFCEHVDRKRALPFGWREEMTLPSWCPLPDAPEGP